MRPDPTIGGYIRGLARYGAPLDVVPGPRRPTGEALSDLLTSAALIQGLDRASSIEAKAVP